MAHEITIMIKAKLKRDAATDGEPQRYEATVPDIFEMIPGELDGTTLYVSAEDLQGEGIELAYDLEILDVTQVES